MAAGLDEQPSQEVRADGKHEERDDAPAASGPAPAVMPTTTLEVRDGSLAFTGSTEGVPCADSSRRQTTKAILSRMMTRHLERYADRKSSTVTDKVMQAYVPLEATAEASRNP